MKFGPRKSQRRKIPAIAALGLAGFLGVAACTTVTFDSHGNPVADWTDVGTELLPPTGG